MTGKSLSKHSCSECVLVLLWERLWAMECLLCWDVGTWEVWLSGHWGGLGCFQTTNGRQDGKEKWRRNRKMDAECLCVFKTARHSTMLSVNGLSVWFEGQTTCWSISSFPAAHSNDYHFPRLCVGFPNDFSSKWNREAHEINLIHQVGPLSAELTRLLEDGAPLVAGGAQAGSADVEEAGLVDASVKDTQQRLLVLPLGHDLVVDEGRKHLRLDEVGEEGQVGLRLVGEERGLEKGKAWGRRCRNTCTVTFLIFSSKVLLS